MYKIYITLCIIIIPALKLTYQSKFSFQPCPTIKLSIIPSCLFIYKHHACNLFSCVVSPSFPSLRLTCTRVWDEHGYFNIFVRWGFNNSTQTSHITRYIVTPTLQVGSRGDNIVQFYNSTFIQPQVIDMIVIREIFFFDYG